jgi:hypothetical protein
LTAIQNNKTTSVAQNTNQWLMYTAQQERGSKISRVQTGFSRQQKPTQVFRKTGFAILEQVL